jgi:hypothetical protein
VTDDSASEPETGSLADAPDAEEPISDLTLAEVLAAAAEDLDGVTATTEGSITTWSASGRRFAVLDGEWAEFHLAAPIARAALRTPDAAASPRGPDWVSFAPAALDDTAIDRAEAWFLSAHRLATTIRH